MNNNKNAKTRNNKSTDLRPKFGNFVRTKNALNFDKNNIKEKRITTNNRTAKSIKRKEKIKTVKNNKYKGPLDTKNLIISESIENIHDKINKVLNLNKITFLKLNPLKYSCCAKNMVKFNIEICFLSQLSKFKDTIKNNKNLDKYSNGNINSDKKCLFYIKLLLSKENNDNLNCKLIEKVIDYIKAK